MFFMPPQRCKVLLQMNDCHPGFPNTNVEMDLVVEHWNAVLKQRLAALGGRYTEESIERIGASLNLASLLESKLYPTYTERLESFPLSFQKMRSHSGETTGRRPALGSSETDFWDQVADGALSAKVYFSLSLLHSTYI